MSRSHHERKGLSTNAAVTNVPATVLTPILFEGGHPFLDKANAEQENAKGAFVSSRDAEKISAKGWGLFSRRARKREETAEWNPIAGDVVDPAPSIHSHLFNLNNAVGPARIRARRPTDGGAAHSPGTGHLLTE